MTKIKILIVHFLSFALSPKVYNLSIYRCSTAPNILHMWVFMPLINQEFEFSFFFNFKVYWILLGWIQGYFINDIMIWSTWSRDRNIFKKQFVANWIIVSHLKILVNLLLTRSRSRSSNDNYTIRHWNVIKLESNGLLCTDGRCCVIVNANVP